MGHPVCPSGEEPAVPVAHVDDLYTVRDVGDLGWRLGVVATGVNGDFVAAANESPA